MMQDFVRLTRAISDPNRVRVLMFLRDGELCLCQIIEILGLSSSTVSKHMSVLLHAGLVVARKQGKWRYFRLPGKSSPRFIRDCLAWIDQSLATDRTIGKDGRKRTRVSSIPAEEFCMRFGNADKKRNFRVGFAPFGNGENQ